MTIQVKWIPGLRVQLYPGDIKDYVIDWTRYLETGETLSSDSVTADAGVTAQAISGDLTTTTSSIRLTAGATPGFYDVAPLVVTSLGQQWTAPITAEILSTGVE